MRGQQNRPSGWSTANFNIRTKLRLIQVGRVIHETRAYTNCSRRRGTLRGVDGTDLARFPQPRAFLCLPGDHFFVWFLGGWVDCRSGSNDADPEMDSEKMSVSQLTDNDLFAPNPAGAVDAPIARLFASQSDVRRATDQRR